MSDETLHLEGQTIEMDRQTGRQTHEEGRRRGFFRTIPRGVGGITWDRIPSCCQRNASSHSLLHSPLRVSSSRPESESPHAAEHKMDATCQTKHGSRDAGQGRAEQTRPEQNRMVHACWRRQVGLHLKKQTSPYTN